MLELRQTLCYFLWEEMKVFQQKEKRQISFALLCFQVQIPVSRNKIIQVELEDKGDASYLKKVGKLLWEFKLAPGQSNKLNFKYSVKYPKDEKISGAKQHMNFKYYPSLR